MNKEATKSPWLISSSGSHTHTETTKSRNSYAIYYLLLVSQSTPGIYQIPVVVTRITTHHHQLVPYETKPKVFIFMGRKSVSLGYLQILCVVWDIFSSEFLSSSFFTSWIVNLSTRISAKSAIRYIHDQIRNHQPKDLWETTNNSSVEVDWKSWEIFGVWNLWGLGHSEVRWQTFLVIANDFWRF